MQPSYPVTPPQRFWRFIHFPLVTLVIGLAIVALFVGAYQFTVVKAANALAPHNPWLGLLLTIGGVAIAVAGYRVFNRFVERRPNVEFARADALREAAAGIAAGLLLFSAVIGVIALLGGYHVLGTNPATAMVPALTIGIVSGFVEEIVFRALIFRLLEQWLGSWVALALSAVLFGALHLGNANATLLAGAAIALEAGVMLAALYMLTRRLWAPIGLHAAWNFAQGGIYGVPVSGIAVSGLLRERPSGSDLLTGGAFGAEASLPAIIICTAFGAVLIAACVRNDRVVPFLPRRAVQRADEQA